MAEQGVWRRCLVRDDWGGINDTDAKSDEEVRWRLEGTALYKTLRGCIRDREFFFSFFHFVPLSPGPYPSLSLFYLPTRSLAISPDGGYVG